MKKALNLFGGDFLRKFDYELIDVFTDEPFGGNQLAVFKDAAKLTDEEMQRITSELNLSEATFITSAAQDKATVRIFTPNREVPIAGHPTIGTGYVLARDGLIQTVEGENSYLFKELVGEIPIKLYKKHGEIETVEMIQPLPDFKAVIADKESVSALLSIDAIDISDRSPMQIVSAGVPFLFVPIKDSAAMKQIKFRQDVWEKEFLAKGWEVDIFAFSLETLDKKATVHSRMFGPTMGISEDPATGAASGPLGAYLVHYGLVSEESEGNYLIISEQGIEIERPSQIRITVESKEGKINHVSIAGSSVDIGYGTIVLKE